MNNSNPQDKEEIKPCPFCGAEAKQHQSYTLRGVRIYCTNIQCHPKPEVFIEADAIQNEDGRTYRLFFDDAVIKTRELWNTRPDSNEGEKKQYHEKCDFCNGTGTTYRILSPTANVCKKCDGIGFIASPDLSARVVEKLEELRKKQLELNWEIEKFPASLHQTETVIKSSSNLEAIKEIIELIG